LFGVLAQKSLHDLRFQVAVLGLMIFKRKACNPMRMPAVRSVGCLPCDNPARINLHAFDAGAPFVCFNLKWVMAVFYLDAHLCACGVPLHRGASLDQLSLRQGWGSPPQCFFCMIPFDHHRFTYFAGSGK